ncbi:MAG TPA: hypothetical protein VD963_10730 [Phycisphaerales bacterium]|nr:hypothetical protein [Phycisphaerales bacterium]
MCMTLASSTGGRSSILDDPAAPGGAGLPTRDSPAGGAGLPTRGSPGPVRRLRSRRLLAPAAGLLLAAAGAGLYLALRPAPPPDFATAPMDELFNYALLTDDFNRLPIRQRLDLLRDLVDRLKNMGSADSALLAGFAAQVRDKARAQLMENASRLAIDVWDEFAKDYGDVPRDQRADYLNNAFLEFSKMMEAVAGEHRDVSDSERLAEAREQAERDKRAVESGRGPSGEQFGRMFRFMREDVGQHASPQQRTRGQLMMRDMSRHFRGEDR